jgi:hypothetical protein
MRIRRGRPMLACLSQPADAMQPVDPLAVPAVRLEAPPQLVAVAGIDQEDLKPLGLEQLVQGAPVDAGRLIE